MDANAAEAEMHEAHAAVGGLIARCSLLDYRLCQFMARWFCVHDKQKFLSYSFRAMPFAGKRQIIEERLTSWHDDPQALRDAMTEVAAIFERRNLVASGVLSRRSTGALCIKSFSGALFISQEGAIDILDIADLPDWSEKASELAERLVALGMRLKDTAR